jgi:NAD(P)-dependent dehydrogenase (short-subunit alcohol dehydrogenase family)
MSVYGATKAALESLTRTWATEFGGSGIRVNAIAPGTTRSDKVMSVMGAAAEQMGAATPLGRTAATSEIARVAVFLASDQSSYLTGATIPVDGDRTAI